MLMTSTVNLLKTLSLSAGIHAEVMQLEATRTLCGLLRMLVESGVNDKTGMNPYGVECVQTTLVLCGSYSMWDYVRLVCFIIDVVA